MGTFAQRRGHVQQAEDLGGPVGALVAERGPLVQQTADTGAVEELFRDQVLGQVEQAGDGVELSQSGIEGAAGTVSPPAQ
ncbi:hypothetical protein [Amycolatopsis sp. PS_44_ISF1]|uniref:hypothetical protein n=1 Tax=Amycolatopsis sp. PS_44_ISF1 TaxID=2974917 RepID=UPI0028DF50F1|nr:hypothetical protein [Amycolatopsis sp. PS_44_ISF1]MDT8913496.1 hypothetical protein [Amycolatopsis sp. PS_44_ISF1]